MYLGKVVEYGVTEEIIREPLHPYTQALISAVPAPGSDKPERIVLRGDVPSPANPPAGCPFHPRCPKAMAVCREQVPVTRQIGSRQVQCHLYCAADHL